MSTGKTYSTKYLLDTNNNRGAEGQVLISTSEGVNWSDGSDITGGPYLPLSAGSSYPLTDTLYIKPSGSPTNTMLISARADDTYGNIQFTNAAETANWTELRSTSTQFTINNVNVGIGTTSPGHKLHVENTESASWTTRFSNTVANSNNIYFGYNNGTTSYGMYIDGGQGAAGYDIQTASGFTVRGSGNVGIGTTSPNSSLQVGLGTTNQQSSVASIGTSVDGLTSVLSLVNQGGNNTDGNGVSLDFHNAANWSATGRISVIHPTAATGVSTNSSMQFSTYGTVGSATSFEPRMTIDYAGNVGIGTTSPDHTLMLEKDVDGEWEALRLFNYHSDGSTVGSVAINMDVRASNGQIARASIKSKESTADSPYSELGFFTSNTTSTAPSERMTIDKNGNVGIGTTSPGTKLHLNNSATLTPTYQKFTNGTATTGTTLGIDSDGDFIINNEEAKEIKLYTNDSQRVTIQSGGNVGIGTTSPGYKLHVDDNTSYGGIFIEGDNAPGLTIRDNSGTSESKIYVQSTSSSQGNLRISSDDNNTATTPSIEFIIGNSEKVRISDAGNVGIGTTSPSERLEVHSANAKITANSTADSQTVGFEAKYMSHSSLKGTFHYTTADARLWIDNHFTGNNGNYSDIIFRNKNVGGDQLLKERLIIKGSSGNVGIGTTSPSAKLEVNGNVVINSTGLTEGFQWFNDTNEIFSLEDTSGAGELLLLSSNSVKVKLNANGNSYFNGGNVGIGTTSPTAPLHVIGTVRMGNTSEGLTFSAGSGIGNIIGVDTGFAGYNAIALKASANTGIYLDTADNVGIGTTSPGSKLVVQGSGEQWISVFTTDVTGAGAENGYRTQSSTGSRQNTLYRHTATNLVTLRAGTDDGAINFIAGGSAAERMRITSTGNVGIGTTSPSEKLQVDGNVQINGLLNVDNDLDVGATATFNDQTFFYDDLNISGGIIDSDTTITATNFILSSDERLKENVKKVCDNRVKVDWKTFELKTEKGQKRYGVIAQELEKTNPEFVRENNQGFKSVAYIDLLIAKIAELEARLEKLEK